MAYSIVNIYHSSVVQAGQLWRSPRSARLAGAGHCRPAGPLLKSFQKKFACGQVYIVRIWTLPYISEQRSPNRFGPPELTSHTMSCGAIYSIRNENIQCLRSSIMRERIAKNVYVTRCTCERCGHIWEVPDGQKIQSSCPSRSCRSIFWDRPITRQGVSKFAKAARPKDWAARRARGWKHPASKS